MPVPTASRARPPIAARTLALAHRMQAMIVCGEVSGPAELAELLGFTRARISQILDLTLLAPDIQEHILFAEESGSRDLIREHDLRRVVREVSWAKQRLLFARR